MSICPLKVLVIVAASKRAIVHQLQGDMNRYTVIFGYDFPVFVYVVENSLLEKGVSSSMYTVAQHACSMRGLTRIRQKKGTQDCCCFSG